MGKKLYVGNLSYDTTEDELRAAFEGAGSVASVSIVTDRETGSSKGFGFVEMETDEDAQKAIESLNGHKLNGRDMRVDEARPPADRGSRPPRGDRGGYGGGGGYGSDRDRGSSRSGGGRSR
jgi:cold-inducible RNA-binding protein